MKAPIVIPRSERGTNYSVAGETWCENFERESFAQAFAIALSSETGQTESVLRESDCAVWLTSRRQWEGGTPAGMRRAARRYRLAIDPHTIWSSWDARVAAGVAAIQSAVRLRELSRIK